MRRRAGLGPLMPVQRPPTGRLEPGFRPPTHPYVAPHTMKIHTPITLGIRHRAKLRYTQ